MDLDELKNLPQLVNIAITRSDYELLEQLVKKYPVDTLIELYRYDIFEFPYINIYSDLYPQVEFNFYTRTLYQFIVENENPQYVGYDEISPELIPTYILQKLFIDLYQPDMTDFGRLEETIADLEEYKAVEYEHVIYILARSLITNPDRLMEIMIINFLDDGMVDIDTLYSMIQHERLKLENSLRRVNRKITKLIQQINNFLPSMEELKPGRTSYDTVSSDIMNVSNLDAKIKKYQDMENELRYEYTIYIMMLQWLQENYNT